MITTRLALVVLAVCFATPQSLGAQRILANGRVTLGWSADSGVKQLGYECRGTFRSTDLDTLLTRGTTDDLGRFTCFGPAMPDLRRLDLIVLVSDDRPPLTETLQEVCNVDYIVRSGPCSNALVSVSRVTYAAVARMDTVYVTRYDTLRVDNTIVRVDTVNVMPPSPVVIPTLRSSARIGFGAGPLMVFDARDDHGDWGAALYVPVVLAPWEMSLTYGAFSRPTTAQCCSHLLQPALALKTSTNKPFVIIGVAYPVQFGGQLPAVHEVAGLAGVGIGGSGDVFGIELRTTVGRRLRTVVLGLRIGAL